MSFGVNVWQRFDVQKTGHITFEEFCIMMGPVRDLRTHSHAHTRINTYVSNTSEADESPHVLQSARHGSLIRRSIGEEKKSHKDAGTESVLFIRM